MGWTVLLITYRSAVTHVLEALLQFVVSKPLGFVVLNMKTAENNNPSCHKFPDGCSQI